MKVLDRVLRAGDGKRVKALQGLVPDINALGPEMALLTDDALRAQIHAKHSEASIRDAAVAGGMVLMREDGERLVRLGISTEEELIRVTRD